MKILKFYTPTCMPCRVVGKLLDSMNLNVESIDATEDIKKVDEYQIYSTPALVFLNDEGKEVARSMGLITKSQLEDIIKDI